MESRTLKLIEIRLTGNSLDDHYLLNLRTRHVITRFTRTVLPIPTRICKLVRGLMKRPPIALEVLDVLQHEVPGVKPDNDGAYKDYVPGIYDENSDNYGDDGEGGGENDIDLPQEPANIDTNGNGEVTIILNPAGP